MNYFEIKRECGVCKKSLPFRRKFLLYCNKHGREGREYQSGDYIFEGIERTREAARKRDNYTCQDCGKVWIKGERRFDIHHFKECGKKSRKYEPLSELPNMITLYHKCHFNRPEHRCKSEEFKIKKWGTSEKAVYPIY